MTQKNQLTDQFSRAVKGGGVPLTPGEVALVESIFGKKMRTSHVLKYFADTDMFPNADLALTDSKGRIRFNGSKNFSVDYSNADTSQNFNTFVHEMTHVWQFQHKIRNYFRFKKYPPKYDYYLNANSRFKDFGIEQQATIIGDYAVQFLYPKRSDTLHNGYYKPSHNTNYQSLALLQKVVEDKFSEARKTRLAFESQKKTVSVAPPGKNKL